MRKIIFVTCTYQRPGRLAFFERHIDRLMSKIDHYRWIVIEDGDRIDPELQALIGKYNSTYLAAGPTKDKGNFQRNAALEYIRDNKIDGVVYSLDDDNLVYPELCRELRKVFGVAIFPVGNLGPTGIEHPVIQHKKLVDWNAGWKQRRYPVDMGGFAFSSSLIFHLPSPIWRHRGVAGETEFLERLAPNIDQVDFSLCHWNKMCFVFHNEPLEAALQPVAIPQ
jgi:hypothetical protein